MTKKIKKDETNFVQSKTNAMFALVTDKNGKINICAAGMAVSQKKFDTHEQAEKYIGSKPYEILVNLMFIVIKLSKENENNNENPQDK